MRASSLDLRERIIKDHEEGVSVRKLAKQFKVSCGMVWNLIKLQRETGEITPKVPTGGKPRQLARQEKALSSTVKQYRFTCHERSLQIAAWQ
ncbi:MAG: hypothetical protein AAGA16_24635 [Cyanobacteria bacterium P01_E01_bin.35]